MCTVGLRSPPSSFCLAAPASAQYKPRTLDDPATGEKYHIEGGADFWFPTADMVVASEQLGIPGSQIDLKRDLGLVDQRFRALQVQLRPARATSSGSSTCRSPTPRSATLNQDIVFNGIRYRLGLPVNSTLDWKTYEFGYEFDFVVKNWGFVGFDPRGEVHRRPGARSTSPIASEFARARGPIPAIGGIGALLRRPEHLDHRRAHRLQDSRQHRRALQRALRRPRHLRHA